MNKKVKIIFFGDVMGKIGRKAVSQIVPVWQKKYKADILIANVENLAHGKGVTDKTLQEMNDAGINIMTSGNHVWRKEDANYLSQKVQFNLVTPHNDPRTPTGQGYGLFTIGNIKIFVANLLAESGMVLIGLDDAPENQVTSPFEAVDELMKLPAIKEADISLIDFHSEYTSEARALGWYLDGKISATLGTHTHIPTADAQIMPQGTGYITDIGMVGAYKSVLGIDKDIIVDRFINRSKIIFKAPETGTAEINAVYLEIDIKTKKTTKIELLRDMVEIN
jgi:2',3'-cyclic-nucleotide 2'-phosphodiesterase